MSNYLNEKLYARTLNVHPDAPWIVFLHDSLGCTMLWRNFPQMLATAAGMNALIYDRRGYGQSPPFRKATRDQDYMEQEVTPLMDLLDTYQIQHPVLFGHSDGGTIALLAAAKHPDRIQSVITEGAHVFVEEETLDGIYRAQQQYATTHLKERLEKYHGDKTQALFEAWTVTWTSPMYRDWSIVSILPQIVCPVLIIQGSEDEYGTMKQVTSIIEGVSGPAQACIVPNTGHSPHKQNEIWLVNEVCEWLGKQ